MSRHSDSHLFGVLLGLALVCAVSPWAAAAQEAPGTIRGVVTDGHAGSAANVTVSLTGTELSAVSDRAGRFELRGVPAGVFTVRVERGGRAVLERRDVRVAAGGTATLDLLLGADRGRAANPRGEPASRAAIGREELERLPVDDIRHALTLSPGVMLRGTDIGVAGTPSLFIRGSGADQIGVYVDGAPARFDTFGRQGIDIGTDAVSEVSVLTGVPSVAFADTRGGAISYLMRSGGSRLEGSFRATSDGLFGTSSTVGYNRFEGTLGGPVPGLPGLTWLASAVVHGQESAYRGAGAEDVATYVLAGVDTVLEYTSPAGQTTPFSLPRYAQASGECGQTGSADTEVGRAIRDNFGYDCTGLSRPLDWSTSGRGAAKIEYRYGGGSSVSLTGLASSFQRRFYPGADIGAVGLYSGARSGSRMAVFNWHQALGHPLGGALAVRANVAYGSDEYLSGPLRVESSSATADPALGIETSILRFTGEDALPFPLTDEIIRNIRSSSGLRVPFLNRFDLTASQPYRANPYGLASGWPTEGLMAGSTWPGVDRRLAMSFEERLTGRVLLDWQASRAIRLVGGADMSRTDIAYYKAYLYGTSNLTAFRVQPQRVGAFASAQIKGTDVTVDAGVRVDRVRPGGEFPRIPGRVFTNPAWNEDAGTDDTAYAGAMARVFVTGRSQTVFSPRASVALRVDSRTAARLGFGRQMEVPSPYLLFAGTNLDVTSAVGDSGTGADVDIVSSDLIEAGIRHSFSRDLVLDVSAYDKTRLVPYAYATQLVYDPVVALAVPRRILTPWDGRGTGVDARLDWRVSDAVSGAVAYSFILTRYAAPDGASPPEDRSSQSVSGSASLRVPEGWRSGSLAGEIAQGASADLLVRASSGLPYDRLANTGLGTVVPDASQSLFAELLGDSRLPWTVVLDLRLAKSIGVGMGRRLTAFVEIRNLLGTTNQLGAFAETGAAENRQHRDAVVASLRESLHHGCHWWTSDGAIDLAGGCGDWGLQEAVNTVALRRVENRFGNGDGLFTPEEQDRSFNAYYDAFYGAWRFHGPGRTARAGLEVRF